MKKNLTYQNGVTLIELMIAVTISLVLLLGVGSIYSNNKRSYLKQDEFGYMQENARSALKFLIKDVRMSGFLGCAWNNFDSTKYQNYLKPTGDAATDAQLARLNIGLEGYEATNTEPGTLVVSASATGNWHAAIPAYLSPTPVQGSDMIVVRYAAGSGVKLVANKSSANLWIATQGDPNVTTVNSRECHVASDICEGDIVLITDCEKSRLFQVTTGMSYTPNVPTAAVGVDGIKLNHAASGSPGNNAPVSWGGAAADQDFFDPIDSEILKAQTFIYYVGLGAGSEPALFRQSLRGAASSTSQELVLGVENMQILYGIDTDKSGPNDPDGFDGIANRYVPADQISLTADNVVSARISLLMATSRDVNIKTAVSPTAKTYTLSSMATATGTRVTAPADRRIRKVYTTTIKLRNKGVQD